MIESLAIDAVNLHSLVNLCIYAEGRNQCGEDSSRVLHCGGMPMGCLMVDTMKE